jgi:hypothetical protein
MYFTNGDDLESDPWDGLDSWDTNASEGSLCDLKSILDRAENKGSLRHLMQVEPRWNRWSV